MNVCPSCGTPNPVSAKFCQECGTRLAPSEPITTTQPPAEPEQPNAPVEATPLAKESDAESLAEPAFSTPDGAETEESPATTEAPIEPVRPKKDVSGLPPSWMPAPVTLTMKPSGQNPVPSPPPPAVTTTTTTTSPPVAAEEHDETIEDSLAEDRAKPEKDVSGLPPAWMPTPVDLGAPRPIERGGVDEDWKMSDPGPLPERRDRRLWLWIPVGLITAVLICCIAFFIWATTIGEDTVDGWATNAAVNQTEEATNGD